ncbi:MAG: hypothetical protein ACLTZI_02675 [[Eubacterium] siraeum]
MNVKININSAAVKARMTEKTHDAMKLLMSNFLKDCNDYAPQDQSVLINSSIIHTGISADWVPPLGKKVTSEQLQALARAKGSEVEIRNDSIAMVLRWETPYARTLYYGVSKKVTLYHIHMMKTQKPAKCGRIKRNRLKGNSGEDNCRNF